MLLYFYTWTKKDSLVSWFSQMLFEIESQVYNNSEKYTTVYQMLWFSTVLSISF